MKTGLFKIFSMSLVAVLAICTSSCKPKEDISGMVNGVWKTDLSVDVNNNGDNMIVADDFLVLGLDYHSESAGDFIQVFSGTVTSKHFSGIDIPFLVKVDGEWSIEEMSGKMILDKDNGIKLIYDMTSLEIYVGAAEIISATAGKSADVYDRISEKILSRSTIRYSKRETLDFSRSRRRRQYLYRGD